MENSNKPLVITGQLRTWLEARSWRARDVCEALVATPPTTFKVFPRKGSSLYKTFTEGRKEALFETDCISVEASFADFREWLVENSTTECLDDGFLASENTPPEVIVGAHGPSLHKDLCGDECCPPTKRSKLDEVTTLERDGSITMKSGTSSIPGTKNVSELTVVDKGILMDTEMQRDTGAGDICNIGGSADDGNIGGSADDDNIGSPADDGNIGSSADDGNIGGSADDSDGSAVSNPLLEYPSQQFWVYADYKYMCNVCKDTPELLDPVDWGVFGFEGRGGQDSVLWVGSEGACTPCHYDTYGYNVVAQLSGCKRWTLFSPDDSQYMYQTRLPYEELSVFSQVNLDCPDVEEFPKFMMATPYQVSARDL